MAGNNFKIPVWTPELVNWSNQVKANNLAAAKQRQQDWNKVYDMATAYGEARKKEEEAQKARDFQAAENALQRQHQEQMQAESLAAQAAQAAENRKAQAALAAENRKAQQEYNLMVKGLEEAKQKQAIFDKAQVEYATLLGKENRTEGEDMRLKQLIQARPQLDAYDTGEVDEQGNKIMGSLLQDSITNKENRGKKAYELADFTSTLPQTFDKKHPKESAILAIKNFRYSDGTPLSDSDRARLINNVVGTKDLKTKIGESVQGAIASDSGKTTTENLEKQKLQATAKGIVDYYKANGGKITNSKYDKLIKDNPALKDYITRDGLGNLKLKG